MKLAEALIRRADCQKRFEQVKARSRKPGSTPGLQITPSKVTSVRGNVIVTTAVLICFYRRGWVRGLHRQPQDKRAAHNRAARRAT